MQVLLMVSGGFAAGVRRPEQTINADALGLDERAELASLIGRAQRQAAAAPQRRLPDAMSYIISVEDAGQPMVLRGSDGDMTPAFAELLAWVRRHAN